MALAPALWIDALTGDVQYQPLNISAIAIFVAFAGATLYITYWASKRSRSAADHYAAGGRVTGFQSGPAIVGDYMSMASFLGISALVFTSGYDSLTYLIDFLVGWPIILFLIAECPYNLGKYTSAGVVSYRPRQEQTRTSSACGLLVVVASYLIARVIGVGKLIEPLFDLDYHATVVLMGTLIVLYVLFDGMLATTWVQIIKAALLLSGAPFMTITALKHIDSDVSTLLSEAIKVHPKGGAIMSPDGLVKDPISVFFLGFALMFGTARLSHILVRFSTVSDTKGARKSVFRTTGFISYFCILTLTVGFDVILLVSTNPDFRDVTGVLTGGSNMAAVYLADTMGGSPLLDLTSVVAFVIIPAVVAGPTLTGTSAVSHDLYASVFKGGKANEKDELRVSKMTTMTLGAAAIVLGILFEKQNIVSIVGLALSIAASCNFPVLLLPMYWKRLTTRGAMIDGWIGLIIAVNLMVLGPTVWVQILGHEKVIYPYKYPALSSMIVAFVDIWFFSITDRSTAADEERMRLFPQFVRSQTGLDVPGAMAH